MSLFLLTMVAHEHETMVLDIEDARGRAQREGVQKSMRDAAPKHQSVRARADMLRGTEEVVQTSMREAAQHVRGRAEVHVRGSAKAPKCERSCRNAARNVGGRAEIHARGSTKAPKSDRHQSVRGRAEMRRKTWEVGQKCLAST